MRHTLRLLKSMRDSIWHLRKNYNHMKNNKENVLVIGANGTTGQLICNHLKESTHYTPIAMIRKDSQKEKFESKGISTVMGDLEEDFENVFENIDRVIFAAGSGGSTGKEKTIAVDQEGAKKSIDFAKKYNIKKYIMLSSMGAAQPDSDSKIYEYLKAKHHADEYLKSIGISYSIVRPGALKDHDGTGKIKADKSLNNSGEISRENVALTLIETLDSDVAANAAFEILDGDQSIKEAVAAMS